MADVQVGVAHTCVIYNTYRSTQDHAATAIQHKPSLECHGLNDNKQSNVPEFVRELEV